MCASAGLSVDVVLLAYIEILSSGVEATSVLGVIREIVADLGPEYGASADIGHADPDGAWSDCLASGACDFGVGYSWSINLIDLFVCTTSSGGELPDEGTATRRNPTGCSYEYTA